MIASILAVLIVAYIFWNMDIAFTTGDIQYLKVGNSFAINIRNVK